MLHINQARTKISPGTRGSCLMSSAIKIFNHAILIHAPLEISNNILLATPPDTLHYFCAGLMKSLVKIVISIIFILSSKDDGKTKPSFKLNKVLFDRRIATFGYVHDMPHVHWKTFKAGIRRYANKKSKRKGDLEEALWVIDLLLLYIY